MYLINILRTYTEHFAFLYYHIEETWCCFGFSFLWQKLQKTFLTNDVAFKYLLAFNYGTNVVELLHKKKIQAKKHKSFEIKMTTCT